MELKQLSNAVAIVKESVKNMPDNCGIYKMIGKDDKVLYVGKAKNLAKRVTNYTQPHRLEYRLQNMISNVAKVEFTITNTESEALLLESNLIKKFEPKYNILLKDGKSYPYILIADDHDFPRIVKHRNVKKIKGSYYGPFASAGAVNKSIADLQKAFLIRPCADSVFANRERPCMEYQIKRCSAPCVDKITKKDYATLIQQAKDFLSGKSRNIQEKLVIFMEEESNNQNYEKAAIYRDRIKALNQIQAKQNVNINSIGDSDLIALYRNRNNCCIEVCFFRNGQNLGNSSFYPKNTSEQSNDEILSAFIGQFYSDNGNIPPKQIITNCELGKDHEFLEDALSSIHSYRISISCPKIGIKKDVIDDVMKNAKKSLEQNLLRKIKQEDNLKNLQKLFELPNIPKRIEVYDNSHISGTDEVGAMIVAGEEGFNKKAYRRFNIKNKMKQGGDDYAMMFEVITRRFKRLKQEHPEKKPHIWPDLVLIDGGLGHMKIVSDALNELGLSDDIVFACISKGVKRNAGEENFHIPGKTSFTLKKNDPVMHYLQILRDEAHRFAIGSHRKKRDKSITKSALDEIDNIGSKRKKDLLNHFGSLEDIKQASIKDLEKVKGISTNTAKQIYNFLNGHLIDE